MGNPILYVFVLLGLLGIAVATRTDVPTSSKEHGGFVSTMWNSIQDAKKHLVSAAVARSASTLGMYPLDTIKTRIQIQHPNPFRLSGLYRGVGGSLMGQVPYGVLVFGSYEMYKKELRRKYPTANPAMIFALSSLLGDVTGSFWLCPSEVVKQKMQAGIFQNEREALFSIWKSRGFTGFYDGYFGGLARDVPFRVAQLTTYEVTKSIYLKIKSRRMGATDETPVELSALESAACGAVAGSISAAATAPLDRIKTLLMTDGAANGGTVLACAARIFQDEGLMGFTTGVLPRVVYIAPSVALFFVAYETCQQRLKNWN
eukprot:Nitzschia sp. Nitz4//scaffold190_size42200//471//1603//NITZ4_007382-RA/size42200-snap-gene-0.83-mRNA-1//-1//CDS//3329540114//6679//frame0